MAWAGTTTFIDNFDRAQAFTTTPGMNGWTIKDTSSGGTPTYLCATEDGGGCALTLVNTNEAEIVTLYHNDVLQFDLRNISNFWWVAKVSGIDAVTTLVMGMANAQNDTSDSVGVSVWFRMEGSASTSALVCEHDDGAVSSTLDDQATGTTLSTTYKRLMVDFTQGLSDLRFFVDGARVAASSSFDMSSVAAGQNVQPYIQIQKASGTGTPAVSIAQWGITYKWSYGS
jgi:hypothetical protein